MLVLSVRLTGDKKERCSIAQEEQNLNSVSQVMDITILSLTVAFLVAVIAYVINVRNPENARVRSLVNKIPGPRSYPFVGCMLPFLWIPKEDWFTTACLVLEQYKPLMRWWLGGIPIISVTQPEHVEVILNNSKLLEKSSVYRFLYPWLGKGLLTSSGAKWHSHRKIITPTFHFSILEGFVDIFAEKSKILVQKLQKKAGEEGFELMNYISKCSLDIICESAMGTPVNAQNDDNKSGYVGAVYGMTQSISERLARPELHPEIIYYFTSHGRANRKCLQVVQDFVNKIVKGRQENRKNRSQSKEEDEDADLGRKKRLAFLDMLLDANENGERLTDEEIREEVHTFMFEGHDTVSAAMNWTLFLLGQHPQIQERVYQEQENILHSADVSPTMRDLQEMKYLEMVIKESLRHYPSVPSLGRLVEKDFNLGGYVIPAGVQIEIPIHFVHKNPDFFPEPNKFDPDNFLPESVVGRNPYAYVPFSAGSRNCIGQRFALLEMKTVLSHLIRRFRFESIGKCENVKKRFEFILRSVKPIKMKITLRGQTELQREILNTDLY